MCTTHSTSTSRSRTKCSCTREFFVKNREITQLLHTCNLFLWCFRSSLSYAGPNSQRVLKTFPLGSNTNNWLMYMKSSEHNTIVASVDARGTTMRSDSFRFLMYRKLGQVEIEDQLEAARLLSPQKSAHMCFPANF